MNNEEKRKKALAIAFQRSVRNAQNKQLEAWKEEVPKRFREFDYNAMVAKDSPVHREAKRKIKQFVKQPKGFLVMSGPTGTGKTTSACAIVAAIIDDYISKGKNIPGGRPKFYSANELLRKFSVMDRVKDSQRTVAEATYDSAVKASFLVIDDIGAGNNGLTERQERMFWDALNERHNDPEKITLLTTNMPIRSASEGQSLAEWLQESMWDRVSTNMVDILFKGTSLRR